MALKLATDPALLRAYRERLTRARGRVALFDTRRTTRHIEAAYEEMVARRAKGLLPAGFAAPE